MRRKLTLCLRLLLGGIFLYAAWTKLRQPWTLFALSIDSYQLFPSWLVFAIARTLPWLELMAGLLLMTGRYLRYTAPAVALLMLGFNAAMLRAYLGGATIDCGCFGAGEAIGVVTLARDTTLFACAVVLWVFVWKRETART